jgi:hypothetical protein
VFIAIGEFHVGLAWAIRVIPFWKQIALKISWKGLASRLDKAQQGQFINLHGN